MGLSSRRIAEPIVRTATETFEVYPNGNQSSVFIIDVSDGATETDTIVVSIDGYDTASKTWYNILTSAAIDDNVQVILKVGLEYTAATNLVANDFLPRKYRLVVTKNTETEITYSIGSNELS